MPRVLCVLNRLVIGGPAIVATSLTKHLSSEFETLMVIGGKDDHEQDAIHLTESLGIQPIIIPEMKRALHWKSDIAAYKKMKDIIKEFKPDIVHTHAAKSGAIGRLAASAEKVPVVIHTFHGHVFHSYFNAVKTQMFINIERYLAKKTSGIIAISNQQKNELSEIYKICPNEKIKVINLGLDLEKFCTEQEKKRNNFRTNFQIEDDEIVVGIVGRIVPIKNHQLFVAAANEVLSVSNKKIRFFIIGDGDMRGLMESNFNQAGINYCYYPDEKTKSTAVCTSWQTEMDIVFAGLDIVALTSNNEGTPVSLIEGQAAGKPIVSTFVGGVKDVMLENITGFTTPKSDVKAFANALSHLIENEELRKEFGRAGQKFVQENFSIKKMVTETALYYNQLLNEK